MDSVTVRSDQLTVERVHSLVDLGLVPFGLCGACGPTPLSLNLIDGRWRVTCPGCDLSWSASAISWRNLEGAKQAGWSLTLSQQPEPLVFDDQRNRVH